mmetsp:Transcript_21643/g.28991  ORF Transcript_21643/g.28991 Transcript_21643/m.28991 type:complete len:142 (+) Transcript_21643:1371-1796(+)
MGSRKGMSTTFGLCAIAAFLLLIAESTQALSMIPFTVLATQFGCSAAFAMLYMATLEYFPTHLLGTVFGICNVTARSITILSPMVAEAARPTPTIMIVATCLAAVLFSTCLRSPQKPEKQDITSLPDGVDVADSEAHDTVT